MWAHDIDKSQVTLNKRYPSRLYLIDYNLNMSKNAINYLYYFVYTLYIDDNSEVKLVIYRPSTFN